MATANSLRLLALTLTIVAGCAVQPQPMTVSESSSPTPPSALSINPEIQHRRFPTETLYSLLVAELSASRQQFDVTIKNYIEQAYYTKDKAVIAHAARITQYFNRHAQTIEMGQLWRQKEPDNPEAIVIIANAHLGLQQPLKALDYAEELVQLHQNRRTEPLQDKQDIGAFFETIANYGKLTDKQTRNALIERYHNNVVKNPELAGIKVGLSILYEHNLSIGNAFQWVNSALKQEPERNSAIAQEILLLHSNNNTSIALKKLERLLNKDPNNNPLRLLYARLLTDIDVAKAYEQFTRLSLNSHQQLDIQFSRALLALELDKLATAKSLLEELVSMGYRLNSAQFYLGHIAELEGNLDIALSLYLSVNSGENHLPAHHRAGRIFIKQQKLTEARQLFSDLRKQHIDKKETIYIAETNLLIKYQINDLAILVLNEAITNFPNSTTLRYNRSTVYERQDELVLMENDFRHILSIDPDNVNALNGLGYFLTIRTDRYQEAYSLIKRALALSPDDAAIIDSMGWVKFKLGRYNEAIALLQKALSLYPDPEVAAHLGEVLWVQGEQQKAKQVLKQSLDKTPEAPEILEILKRLNINL